MIFIMKYHFIAKVLLKILVEIIKDVYSILIILHFI